MRGEVSEPLAQVVGAGNDLALRHNHRTDGDLVQFGGTLGFLQGKTHETNVVVAEGGRGGLVVHRLEGQTG